MEQCTLFSPTLRAALSWSGRRAGGPGNLSFMTLVLASHTGSLVWWPIRESVWVLARARGPGWGERVTSRSAVCSAGRGSITGPEDPEPAGEPWYDWPSCPECPIPSHKTRLAYERKALILIINDMSLFNVEPEQTYYNTAVTFVREKLREKLQ